METSNVVALPPRLSNHFDNLTTGTVDGKGLFDELMNAVKGHLLEEYNAQRLKGADYAKVYLGAMESVLANSVQYCLGVSLTDAQLEKLKEDTALVVLQQDQTRNQTTQIQAQTNLTDEQARLVVAQTNTEDALRQLRVDELTENILATEAGKERTIYETTTLLPSQKIVNDRTAEKISAERALIDAKIGTELKQQSVQDAQIAVSNAQAAALIEEPIIKREKIQADAWSAKVVADPFYAGQGPSSWT